MSTKDGGPAFPTMVSRSEDVGTHYRTIAETENGMSLRDYFAAHAPIHDARALGGWMDADQRDAIYRAAAEHAYRFADAMLAARSQR